MDRLREHRESEKGSQHGSPNTYPPTYIHVHIVLCMHNCTYVQCRAYDNNRKVF